MRWRTSARERPPLPPARARPAATFRSRVRPRGAPLPRSMLRPPPLMPPDSLPDSALPPPRQRPTVAGLLVRCGGANHTPRTHSTLKHPAPLVRSTAALGSALSRPPPQPAARKSHRGVAWRGAPPSRRSRPPPRRGAGVLAPPPPPQPRRLAGAGGERGVAGQELGEPVTRTPTPPPQLIPHDGDGNAWGHPRPVGRSPPATSPLVLSLYYF